MDNGKDCRVGQLTKFWPYIFLFFPFLFIHLSLAGLIICWRGPPALQDLPVGKNQCFHIWSILSKVNLGHMQLIFIFHPFPSWSPCLKNSGNWVAMAMRKRVKKIFRKHKYFQYNKETTVLSSSLHNIPTAVPFTLIPRSSALRRGTILCRNQQGLG